MTDVPLLYLGPRAEDLGGGKGLTPMALGLLFTQDLQVIFNCCDETIHNMVKRRELPPPVKVGGRNVWTMASIYQHIAQRLEAESLQAEREQAQKDAKVQALHGGRPHGRRR